MIGGSEIQILQQKLINIYEEIESLELGKDDSKYWTSSSMIENDINSLMEDVREIKEELDNYGIR